MKVATTDYVNANINESGGISNIVIDEIECDRLSSGGGGLLAFESVIPIKQVLSAEIFGSKDWQEKKYRPRSFEVSGDRKGIEVTNNYDGWILQVRPQIPIGEGMATVRVAYTI